MPSLYHRVPSNMMGTTLYPLNTLRYKFPAIFAREERKYWDRSHLPRIVIPRLGCPWNDVLFLVAVHPEEYKKELKRARPPDCMFLRFFEIDVGTLDPSLLMVYLGRVGADPKGVEQYETFSRYRLDINAKIPESTQRYWCDKIRHGEDFLLFQNIPQYLYRGEIDIQDCRIHEVRV